MIKSMTGYGKGVFVLNERRLSVEIKSVNHRYCDISLKMPYMLNFLEETARKQISEAILRGKVDVYIGFETLSKDDVSISLNTALADAYVAKLFELKEKYPVKDDINVSLVAKFPDIINIEKGVFSEQTKAEIAEALHEAVAIALVSIVEMRSREGEALKQSIFEKISIINFLMSKLVERSPLVVSEYKAKLKNRLDEMLGNAAFDESRLLTEVTIFADKSCVDEEITRLASHVSQMENIFEEEGSVGRKLDFLVQEMNREVNTIGSKSNDLEITKIVIDLKTEIEKIREQVQNIE